MQHWAARIGAAALALVAGLGFLCPFTAKAAEAQVDVGTEVYIVMDAATGQVLAEKNAHRAAYPASITKIMTEALTLEHKVDVLAENPLVPVSDAAVDALIPRATQVALIKGEEAPLVDLLYATMIESANDASHALAEYVGGSMAEFAAMMNEKAEALGLAGTHFTNPSGQPDEAHVTTAYDMAQITRWALSVEGFRTYFSATKHAMAPTNKQPLERQFNSANLALVPNGYYACEGVTGSKTGYTDDAMYTMVTTAYRGGTELICVVMQCPTNEVKYEATNALLDYGFGNFRRVSYAAADMDVAHSVPVYGGGSQALGEIDLYCETDASFLLHNSLGLEAVQLQCTAPERYVIGEPFEAVLQLALPQAWKAQSGVLMEMPLAISGLDEILASNTAAALGLGRGTADEEKSVSPWLWVGILVPALLVVLVAARILYVRRRRERRRRARLAAARARMPISLMPRPQPAASGRQQVPYRKGTAVTYTGTVQQRGSARVVVYQAPRRGTQRAGRAVR